MAALVGTFVLLSSVFHAGQSIPRRYTCDGSGTSPPLSWTAPPPRTRSFALRLYDRDARGFSHWLVWGIPRSASGLTAGLGLTQGTNDFGRRGWGPPCPPPGPAHHYVFVLSALARPLTLGAGAREPAFAAAVRRAGVLARATLVGTYRR